MVKKTNEYPVIDIDPTRLDSDKSEISRRIGQYLNEFGFFYMNDIFNIRGHLDDTLLKTLPNAVDVFYGEDPHTGESAQFHGTYVRLRQKEEDRFDDYFRLFSILRTLISLSLHESAEFLDSISQKNDHALYIYQYEAAYLKFLSTLGKNDISVPPHVDKSLITAVISIQGLEGYSPIRREWIPVPDREGYLIVHGGTLLQEWTRGKIKAEVHRVIASDSSKAIFWGWLPPTGIAAKQ
uniref:2OG-Fe(II) oxygenase superfamily protein n=1 Tax=Candidatus Kentrum sp. LFY TaxID=2126342 RepID=A0A450U853_9GAMM|nr:MAG: 2OG-Fe(II) oxygenase superfamily protein [Candidatus Kentron sp. LFY]